MKHLLLIVSIIISTICQSQVVKYYNMGRFNKIKASGNIEVTLDNRNSDSIKISWDKDLIEKVKVVNKNGALLIDAPDKVFGKQARGIVTLSYRGIENIEVVQGAEINSNEKVTIATLKLNAGSGGLINIKIDAIKITASIGKGSTISLEGQSKKLEVEAFSGAIYEGFDMKCDSVDAKSRTGALAKVYVTTWLDANASTGGKVIYRGQPSAKKEDASLGGKVENTPE